MNKDENKYKYASIVTAILKYKYTFGTFKYLLTILILTDKKPSYAQITNLIWREHSFSEVLKVNFLYMYKLRTDGNYLEGVQNKLNSIMEKYRYITNGQWDKHILDKDKIYFYLKNKIKTAEIFTLGLKPIL